MSGNSFIEEIINTLLGYVSENTMNRISSKFHDIYKINAIKNKIEKQLEIALDEFNNASKDEEYVFDELTKTLKDFSTEKFLKAYAVAFSEPDQLEKAKEQIFQICINNTQAKTDKAQNNVKNIINKCFSIVKDSFVSKLTDKDRIQIGLINKHNDENNKKILENSNQNTKKILDEIKDIRNSQCPAPTQPKTEFDTLKEGRKLSQKYFNSISDKGRFKSYINTNNERIVIKNVIKNKLKTSKNSKEYDLSELVFISPGDKDIDINCSLSLHGIGGTGKTFQLLSLYDLILKSEYAPYDSAIPFYLELNDVRTNADNCVLFELAKRLEVDINTLTYILKSKGNNVILMLDGYNEVTDDALRVEIAKRICDIRRDYKTRIIITSRLDHSSEFNRINLGDSAVFTQAEIQKLTPKQVNDYFKYIKVYDKSYNRLSPSLQLLVQTAQGLSMYGALLKKNSEKKIENLGTLLREYVNYILIEDAKDTSFENYLSEIAYEMVLRGCFEISLKDLKLFFDKKEMKEKYGDININSIIDNKYVKKMFVEDTNGNYEFTHQNFRDMYCAQNFNGLISDIENNLSYFKPNNVTSNYEVLGLCGDLIKNDTVIQNAINKLKNNIKGDYSFVLSTLIRIFAFRNGNDIHKLNLEGLDLSKISLSGYILYHLEYHEKESGEKLKVFSNIKLKGATVSEDTFESNGLKRGASTISKYTKDETEYIVAFCSDNLTIYNTKTLEWHSIRYHFKDTNKKFGWINCACKIEEEQKIILGTENGHITFFSYKDEPCINTDPNQFIKYNDKCNHTDLIDGCSVESIVQVKNPDTSETMLVASNSSGAVFVLNSDEIIRNPDNSEILKIRQDFYTNYNESDTSICKLTVNGRYCFCSWGNKIFRIELSKNCKDLKEWKTLTQPCIFDIYCTDEYLFVNTGKEMLGILVDDGTIFDSYSYSKEVNNIKQENVTRQDKINRFTKISNFENCSDKAVVGVSAEDQDRNTVPNYIMLTIETGVDEDDEVNYFINHTPIFGIEQTMTTFSTVSFKQDGHLFIAGTSNDRTIQIIAVNMEDFKAIRHSGTYDGVHHIEIISTEELLLSQYDGSVSHWKRCKKSNEWHCQNVYPIHKDWVWKTRYYVDNNNNAYIFSCSYDGTLKRTNMRTYETDTLIEDDDKIIDLALIKSNQNQLSAVCAITEKKIISYDYRKNESKAPIYIADNEGLCEQYKGDANYAIKSISPAVGKVDEGTFFVAVNFYANQNEDLTNTARIYSVSSGNLNLVKSINPNNADEFENYSKIDEIKKIDDSLVVTGQKNVSGVETAVSVVYSETSNQKLNYENLKTLSDLKERRALCITMQDKQVFIGCLDGSVFTLDYDDILDESILCNLTPAFLTHANLISVYSNDMKNVLWLDNQQERFKGYFKNLKLKGNLYE